MTTTDFVTRERIDAAPTAAGTRRIQGWIIALSTSAVLWTAIITGVIGLTNLLR